jgi:hypothetical protein
MNDDSCIGTVVAGYKLFIVLITTGTGVAGVKIREKIWDRQKDTHTGVYSVALATRKIETLFLTPKQT